MNHLYHVVVLHQNGKLHRFVENVDGPIWPEIVDEWEIKISRDFARKVGYTDKDIETIKEPYFTVISWQKYD